jgi:hypothetical protein
VRRGAASTAGAPWKRGGSKNDLCSRRHLKASTLASYKIANNYREFMTNDKPVADMRKRFEG